MLLVTAGATSIGAGPPAVPGDPAELLERGEAALARGDPEDAQRAFERAGALRHAADSELGLVRASMQAGQYQRALAFAAHTAGAHRDVPGGAVLYAWLLHVGGQPALAGRVLDRVERRVPGDALAVLARARLRSPTAPVADGALLHPPGRTAPHDAGQPLPDGTRVIATGVLLDGGRRALAPLPTGILPRSLWVRDGLGRRRAVEVERRSDTLGLALLRLSDPLLDPSRPGPAPREPFAGSPAFVVHFATTATGATPAWPLLRAGFLGAADAAGARLQIDIAADAHGAPVLDGAGQLCGVVDRPADAVPRLISLSTLRRELGEGPGTVAEPLGIRAPAAEIYERALLLALQVIAGP